MKISKTTFEIFQNMAQINQGIVFEEPNCLKTMSNNGSIISVYDTDETFPLFAIWDFVKFNSLISAMKIESCEFEFNEDKNCVTITSGSEKINYEYADAGAMPIFDQIKASTDYKKFDKFDFSFELTSDVMKQIKRINSIFGFSEDVLKISMKDDIGTITIFSETNETKSDYAIEIEGVGTGEVYLKVDDMIMIPDNYTANVSEQMIKFQSKEKPLMYFIRTHMTPENR